MMKKICPVCDLPVNEVNYCPRCRRVIRKPVNWEVNYLLNEKRIEINPVMGQPGNQPVAMRPVMNQSDGDKKKSYILPVVLAVFFIAISMTGALISYTVTAVTLDNSYETAVGDDDSGYRDLEEADVIAAGEPCSGYNHFDADGRAIADSMSGFMKEGDYGSKISSEETNSYNYEIEQDNGPVTYYETVKSVYFIPDATDDEEPYEASYEYVDINYDTATGGLHQYVSYLKDTEVSMAYLEQFLRLTEESCGIKAEQSSIPSIMEQVKSRLSHEDGAYILEGIFDINLYFDEDWVQIYVTFNNPETVKNQET
ncbi:hypothetical protein RZO55_16145 [Clostridium boliviensis]|uniref:Zinc ribbon domain-containing protein n=1 Tax=Clostridium boliviensis TaxID=318465 RepID=A0ABU4GNA8_9CLOT|nr:hypothetical protein [Clostridium boliviensis]MDW2799104.1 hypothetical protein [Clostridium boliviensis]